MAQQRPGRYYAQELMIDPAGNIREQIQDALDVWDTARPSFARRAP